MPDLNPNPLMRCDECDWCGPFTDTKVGPSCPKCGSEVELVSKEKDDENT